MSALENAILDQMGLKAAGLPEYQRFIGREKEKLTKSRIEVGA